MPKPYSTHGARKTKINGVAVLTATSKMPGPSFSLPAGRACPNSHGEVCSNCYAQKGCYLYPSVENAQETRFAWVRKLMQSEKGQAEFIRVMVKAIKASQTKYFRGHDSGDFFSLQYLNCWIEICKQLPGISFWFPTREYQSKSPFAIVNPRMSSLVNLASLPNVTVRPSALDIGAPAPVIDGLHAGSCVANPNVHQCPAYRQNGECRDCRHCWTNKTTAVSYPLH